MLRTLLITLLIPLNVNGAVKKLDYKKSVNEYLKVSVVRSQCTMSVYGGGYTANYSHMFCDCVTQVIYRGYGHEAVIDPRILPMGVLYSVQKECMGTIEKILKKVGEDKSPDKVK